MRRSDLSEPVRKSLVRYPAPHIAHYGVVPSDPTTGFVRLDGVAASLRSAHDALRVLPGLAAGANEIDLLRREALSSSRIEGVDCKFEELLHANDGGDTGQTAIAQVKDYVAILEVTLAEARHEGDGVFALATIQRIHAAIMRSSIVYVGSPGEFRKNTVWIGGQTISDSTFNPPPASFVAACMEDHVRYLRSAHDQPMQQDFVTRLAIAHAHFEAVHPFSDGNGRVGRVLLVLMMAAAGYGPVFLSPFIEANLNQYFDGLRAAQQRLDYSTLTRFFANGISESVHGLWR